MNKTELCAKIGEFFGSYFEEDGKLCIDNGEEVFRYDTADELLADWVKTLVMHQHDCFGDSSGNWEKEIVFIHRDVIGAFPNGIRRKSLGWEAVTTAEDGTEQSHGIFVSIVDAIYAKEKVKPSYLLADLT